MIRGAAKGERERIIALAHQTEAMARRKLLRPLEYYLRTEKPKSPQQGAGEMLAMMRRFYAQQEGKTDG